MSVPVCKSKTAASCNIDGHALCYNWDWCHGHGNVCLVEGEVRDAIRQALGWHIERGYCTSLEELERE